MKSPAIQSPLFLGTARVYVRHPSAAFPQTAIERGIAGFPEVDRDPGHRIERSKSDLRRERLAGGCEELVVAMLSTAVPSSPLNAEQRR
jgi:hypothetical protein